jgi:hypothetical protein
VSAINSGEIFVSVAALIAARSVWYLQHRRRDMVAFQKSLLRDCTRWRCPRLVSPERLPRVLAALRTATGVQAAAVDKALRLKNAELADNVYSGVPAHEFGLEQIIEVGPMSGKSNITFWLGVCPRFSI